MSRDKWKEGERVVFESEEEAVIAQNILEEMLGHELLEQLQPQPVGGGDGQNILPETLNISSPTVLRYAKFVSNDDIQGVLLRK